MYRRVIVPLDPEAGDEKIVLPHVRAIAAAFGAEVTFVTTGGRSRAMLGETNAPAVPDWSRESVEEQQSHEVDQARRYLEQQAGALDPGTPVEFVVEAGDLDDGVLRLAEAGGGAIIVMARRDPGLLERVRGDTGAGKLLAQTDAAVLLVSGPAESS